ISRRALHASRRLRYADRHLAREGSGGLLNAVRAGPARPRPRAPARYLAAHLRLTLQGDEVRHATLPVAVRLDDGAEVASEEGTDLDRKMLALSTYLGHAKVTDTYWYLSAVPELMAITSRRFAQFARREQERAS